jgi:hypothetical protein
MWRAAKATEPENPIHPCDTCDNETIASPLVYRKPSRNGAAGCVGFDESKNRRGGRRRKLFTEEPAAIPQRFAAYALPGKCI